MQKIVVSNNLITQPSSDDTELTSGNLSLIQPGKSIVIQPYSTDWKTRLLHGVQPVV